MPKTALEIIDTAVKIGLGAIISGVTTYFITKVSHKNSIEKDKLQRNDDLIEGIAEQVESLHNSTMKYWAYLIEYVRLQEKGKNQSDALCDLISKAMDEIFNNYKEFSNAEAKLLLLGHKGAQENVREFGEYVREFYRKKWKYLTEKQMEEYRSNILRKRELIYSELQLIFK